MEPQYFEISEAEIQNIISDFKNQINPWCEFTHLAKNIPEEKMCQIAVEVFSPYFDASWIRASILEKYKIHYKVENGKKTYQSEKKKISKLYKIANKFGLEIVGFVQPLHETAVILSKEVD